jgi:hypothetical protein
MNFAETNVLDASTLNDYQHCARRYYWRHVRGWSKTMPALALHFGTALHEGMDVAYTWLMDNPAKAFPADIIEAAKARAKAVYSSKVDPDLLVTEELRTEGKLDTMFSAYFSKYPRETFRVLAVERPFALGVTATGYTTADWDGLTATDNRLFSWVGKMDLLTDWDYGIMPVDHKTTTMMGANFDKQWSPNVQMAGYIQAAELLYPGRRIAGAIINALQVAKTRATQDRVVTTRRPDQLEQHHTSLLGWTNLIRNDTIYPQNTTSCTAYGECPFLELCLRHPNAVNEPDLDPPPGYVLETWNPIEHIEKGEG